MTSKQFFDSEPFYEFSICHWTLNSIAPLSFCKVSPLNLCINLVLFVCQKHSILLSDGVNLEIKNMTSFDQTIHIVANSMAPVVFYRNSLSLKILDIRYLKKCIRFELKISKQIAKLCLYRPPSQSKAKAYSEPRRTSTMELFAKMVNIFIKSSILDARLSSEYPSANLNLKHSQPAYRLALQLEISIPSQSNGKNTQKIFSLNWFALPNAT